jgi:hypothetical protein
MPKGPRGEKRPGDMIGIAIMVTKIGAGRDRASPEADAQDPQPGRRLARLDRILLLGE